MCDPQSLRTCRQCGEPKPLDQFQKTAPGKVDASGQPYRLYLCNTCRNTRTRTEYHTDPVKRARQIIAAMNAQPRHKGQRLPLKEAAQMLLDATHCTYCGQPNDGSVTFALDHIHPVKLGGANTLENVTPCCEPCNRAKHDMPAAEYVAWLRGVIQRNAV